MTFLLLLLAALFGPGKRAPKCAGLAGAEALRLAGEAAVETFVAMLERYHRRGGAERFTFERGLWANEWLDFIGALAFRYAPKAYRRMIKDTPPTVFTLTQTIEQLRVYMLLLDGPAESAAVDAPISHRPRETRAPLRRDFAPRRAAFAPPALELSG